MPDITLSNETVMLINKAQADRQAALDATVADTQASTDLASAQAHKEDTTKGKASAYQVANESLSLALDAIAKELSLPMPQFAKMRGR